MATKQHGVIESMVDFLVRASEAKPLSKDKLLAKLIRRFPDRSADSMRNTINAQLPGRIAKGWDIKVERNEKGYWAS